MIYVSRKTLSLLERIIEHLKRNTSSPARILKTDVIHAAIEEYAQKMVVK